ncbi:MAG: Crp/Fnr family transcriptional regulator [Elusimicrobiota bacterium]
MIPFHRANRVIAAKAAQSEPPPQPRMPSAPNHCSGTGPNGACSFQGWGGKQGLSGAACARIRSLWRANLYRRGDVIFYQGNAPASVYFLCQGSVKLVRDARLGRHHILRVVNGPDLLGERAMLAGQPYAASAEVMEDSRVCAIPREAFKNLWRDEPELSRMLAVHLSRKLAESDESACALALLTIREQLAALIVSRLAPGGAERVTFSESRQDLADMLGTSAEVVSRTLSELSRKKLIALDGRSLRVLNGERLRAVAGATAPRPDIYQKAPCDTSMRSAAEDHKIHAAVTQKKHVD